MQERVIELRRTDHRFTLYQHDQWLARLRAEGYEELAEVLHSGNLILAPTGHPRAVNIRLYGYIGTRRQIDAVVALVKQSGQTTFMPDYLYVVYVLQGTQLVFNGVFATNMPLSGPFVLMLPHFVAAGALTPPTA
jgi:hypothetical protein